MKIFYLITTMGHGRGGHFNSLKVTAEAMREISDVAILDIGINPSQTLASANVPVFYIHFDGSNFFSALHSVMRKIAEINPDLLHSFDTRAHFFGRIAALRYRLPLVHTKAGGPNPTWWYPFAKTIVCFSKENYDYFRAQPKFRKTALHLIPNRAVEPPEDPARVAEVRALAKGAPVLMRIARIGDTYAESLRQTIRLAHELQRRGIRHTLVLVGAVEDIPVLKELKDMAAGLNAHFLTESHYTLNAAELLPAADFVVGTGRSVQEASAKGKILLTPLSGSPFPALVNTANIEALMATNFSPRNALPGFDEQRNIEDIVALMQDTGKREAYQTFSRQLFTKHFDIRSILPRYQEIYHTATFAYDCHLIDLILHMISTIRAARYGENKRRENEFSSR